MNRPEVSEDRLRLTPERQSIYDRWQSAFARAATRSPCGDQPAKTAIHAHGFRRAGGRSLPDIGASCSPSMAPKVCLVVNERYAQQQGRS